MRKTMWLMACSWAVLLASCSKSGESGGASAATDPAGGAVVVTKDSAEFTLPLRELQMRPGEPMVFIHVDRKDGGAVALTLTLDPEEDRVSSIRPATVLIDAARHAVGGSVAEMHGDATSQSGAVFLEAARVEGESLIFRDGGAVFETLSKERPETITWKRGGADGGKEAHVVRVKYAVK
jgi:hypothetical protein